MADRSKNKVTGRRVQFESSEGVLLSILFDNDGMAEVSMSDKCSILVFKASAAQTNVIRSVFWDNFRIHNVWRTKSEKKEQRRQEALSSFPPDMIKRCEEYMRNNSICQDNTSVEWPSSPLVDIDLI